MTWRPADIDDTCKKAPLCGAFPRTASLSLSDSLSLITPGHEPRVPPLNLRTVSNRLRPTLALSGKDMEEDSRPAPPDLAAGEACRNELTRTDSGPSSVTVHISKNFVRTKNVARPSTAWTNAKHNSYLASLEASFVKELHQSLGLLSSHSEYSDQFTVLQDGFSRRINFERSQPLPYNAAGSHFVKESSWMQQFRCSGRHNNISVNLQECSTFCSEEMLSGRKRIFTHRLSISGRPCVCHESQQDAVGNISEVSDQNFVDEDQEEKSLSLSRPKRLKMDAADSSTNDQIVPSGDMFSVEIATAGNNLLERKEQVDRKCLFR